MDREPAYLLVTRLETNHYGVVQIVSLNTFIIFSELHWGFLIFVLSKA